MGIKGNIRADIWKHVKKWAINVIESMFGFERFRYDLRQVYFPNEPQNDMIAKSLF